MVSEWYCEIVGREIGPLTPQQLKAMAAKGQILSNDCVRRGARGEWILARQVKGLLDADETPLPAAPPVAPTAPPVVRPSEPEAAAPPVIRINTAVEDDPILRRKKRQRDQQIKMVAVLLGTILVFAVAAIYFSMADNDGKHGLNRLADQQSGESEKRAKKSTPNKPPVQSPETLEKLEGVISLDKPTKTERKSIADILGIEKPKPKEPSRETADEPADEPVEKLREPIAPPEPEAEPAKKNPLLDHDWTDALTRAVVVDGFVRLRIVSAEVVRGAGGTSPRLIITVELGNARAREVKFGGWSRSGVARGAKLYDNTGNPLGPKALGRAVLPGHGPPMSIDTGRTGREELAFEPPPERAEYLLLELPASAFGMEDIVRMKIPAEMISRPAAEPSPRKEKPRDPQPGTPEGDFGISPDDKSFE